MGSSWKGKEPDCSQLLETAMLAHRAHAQGCVPAALVPHTEVCAGGAQNHPQTLGWKRGCKQTCGH